jgi:hypothetical protein
MNEDEEFFAWLDGELDDEAAARVADRVAASPELAARAEQHRRLGAGLRGAFDPLLEADARPPQFQTGQVVDLGARATEREARGGWLGIPQWASMAATLALGLLAGTMIGGGSESPVVMQNGQLVAAASLDRALERQLASDASQGALRVGLTFRDRTSAICRTFNGEAGSGLACRRAGDWRILGLFAPAEGSSGDYRMAGDQDPRLAALVGETIVGEPFDAPQERAAKESGWR